MKGAVLGAAVVLALVAHSSGAQMLRSCEASSPLLGVKWEACFLTGHAARRLRQAPTAPPVLGTINLPPMLSFSDVPVTAVIRRGTASALLPVIPPGLLPGLTPVCALASTSCWLAQTLAVAMPGHTWACQKGCLLPSYTCMHPFLDGVRQAWACQKACLRHLRAPACVLL